MDDNINNNNNNNIYPELSQSESESKNSNVCHYPHLHQLGQSNTDGKQTLQTKSSIGNELELLWNDISGLPRTVLSSKYFRWYMIIGCATGAIMFFINVKNTRWVIKNALEGCCRKRSLVKLTYGISAALVGIPYNVVMSVCLWPCVVYGAFVHHAGIKQARFSVPFYGSIRAFSHFMPEHIFVQ